MADEVQPRDESRALDVAREQIANLEIAMERRVLIGQACGILMERYKMDAEGALAVLKRVSSTSNVKLYEIARELVATRRLRNLEVDA